MYTPRQNIRRPFGIKNGENYANLDGQIHRKANIMYKMIFAWWNAMAIKNINFPEKLVDPLTNKLYSSNEPS